MAANNLVEILNSIVIGSMTPNDCKDTVNTSTVNTLTSLTAIPTVSAISSTNDPGDRSSIVFPTFSPQNSMPRHLWTGITAYPCSKLMKKEAKSKSYMNKKHIINFQSKVL